MGPREEPRRSREKGSLDLEVLVRALPGGQMPNKGGQRILLHVLSYIEFLQGRIWDEQKRHISTTSPQVSYLPVRSFGNACNVTPMQQKSHRQPQKPRKCGFLKEHCGPTLKSHQPLSVSAYKGTKLWSPVKDREKKRFFEGFDAQFGMNVKEKQRQKLVPYHSPSSSDNGDNGPWLLSISLSPNCPEAINLQKTPTITAVQLGLSPSLLSPPTEHFQQSISSPVLFEDVFLSSSFSPDSQKSLHLSTFSVDHSYQSQSEISTDTDYWRHFNQPEHDNITELHRHQGGRRKGRARRMLVYTSLSNEDSNLNSSFSPHAKRRRRGRKGKSGRKCAPQSQRFRKKCVNGFIMFCRVNRRPYLSAHPGTASTTATKELAELWREMSAQERHPYCVKAIQYSILHGRMVKQCSPGLSQDNLSSPEPLSVLLAKRN
ncbi:basic helix-loop-helix and HMG box domain-containing protein 1 [Xenopus tropicalis]|uniref:Basic helix-loop-helix and HMG box domain-containing protein 1 n=1 Tax=Xenopus tropicalis TaxID=8364 RepID=A0A803JY72_XENTR|eukprot:XP_012825164.1 PREDICTED: basic helix-loop-helix and HMG box domain-containing protein 1 [Xenopus tropicalis]